MDGPLQKCYILNQCCYFCLLKLTTGPKQAETGFDAPREYNNAAKKDPRSRSPQRGATRSRNSQMNSQANDIYADRNIYKSYEMADKQGHLY